MSNWNYYAIMRKPISELKPSSNAINLIKHFESCELKAYQDTGGVWTIGFGHTKGVYPGMVIDMSTAIEFLQEDVAEHCEYIYDLVKVPLTQYEFDALASWTFNLGGNALRTSTLLKVLNAGDYEGVPYQMMRWSYDNGVWLRGLARRRHAEALQFNGYDWENYSLFKNYNNRRFKKWLEKNKFEITIE